MSVFSYRYLVASFASSQTEFQQVFGRLLNRILLLKVNCAIFGKVRVACIQFILVWYETFSDYEMFVERIFTSFV